MLMHFILTIQLLFELGICCLPTPDLYMEATSPNGIYRVEVLRIPSPFAFPGQSGDSSGRVSLINMQEKRLVFHSKIQMISEVEYIQWNAEDIRLNAVTGMTYEGIKVGDWGEDSTIDEQ